MKTLVTLSIFIITLTLTTGALAKEVYTDKELNDIYVLATDSGRALIKVKGEEKQIVVPGDRISEDWLEIVEIDYRSVTVKDEYVDTLIRVPVGGGVGF